MSLVASGRSLFGRMSAKWVGLDGERSTEEHACRTLGISKIGGECWFPKTSFYLIVGGNVSNET